MDEISHLGYAWLADLPVADMYRIDSRSEFPMISITCLYPDLFCIYLWEGRTEDTGWKCASTVWQLQPINECVATTLTQARILETERCNNQFEFKCDSKIVDPRLSDERVWALVRGGWVDTVGGSCGRGIQKCTHRDVGTSSVLE